MLRSSSLIVAALSISTFYLTVPAQSQFTEGCYEACKAGNSDASCYASCDCVASSIFSRLTRDEQLALSINPANPQLAQKLKTFQSECIQEQIQSQNRQANEAALNHGLAATACKEPQLPEYHKTHHDKLDPTGIILENGNPAKAREYGFDHPVGASVGGFHGDFRAGDLILRADSQWIENADQLKGIGAIK